MEQTVQAATGVWYLTPRIKNAKQMPLWCGFERLVAGPELGRVESVSFGPDRGGKMIGRRRRELTASIVDPDADGTIERIAGDDQVHIMVAIEVNRLHVETHAVGIGDGQRT